MTDIPMTAPTTPSFRLDGKKALVTGASRGIGFAVAAALAQAGAKVVLAARSETDLKAASRAIANQGGTCDHVALDVADSSAVTREVGRLGPFDVLVNSAGMNRPKSVQSDVIVTTLLPERHAANWLRWIAKRVPAVNPDKISALIAKVADVAQTGEMERGFKGQVGS